MKGQEVTMEIFNDPEPYKEYQVMMQFPDDTIELVCTTTTWEKARWLCAMNQKQDEENVYFVRSVLKIGRRLSKIGRRQ